MSNLLQKAIKSVVPETSKGGRRPTEGGSGTAAPVNPRNPEVSPKAKRRRLTSEYKLRILEELDRCTEAGEKGAIMRREGIYSSSVTEWRRARDAGALGALDKVRGRKLKYDQRDNHINQLEVELAQLKRKLSQAEAIIEVQKKVSEIFGASNLDSESSGRNS